MHQWAQYIIDTRRDSMAVMAHCLENVPNVKITFILKPYPFAHEQKPPLLGNQHTLKPTTHLHHRPLPRASGKTDEHVWLATQNRLHLFFSASRGEVRRRDVTSVSLVCIVPTVETSLTLPLEGCSWVCCCVFFPDGMLPLVELLLFRPLK